MHRVTSESKANSEKTTHNKPIKGKHGRSQVIPLFCLLAFGYIPISPGWGRSEVPVYQVMAVRPAWERSRRRGLRRRPGRPPSRDYGQRVGSARCTWSRFETRNRSPDLVVPRRGHSLIRACGVPGVEDGVEAPSVASEKAMVRARARR